MIDRLLIFLDALNLKWLIACALALVFGMTECDAHDNAVARAARLDIELQHSQRHVAEAEARYTTASARLQVKHDTLIQRVTKYQTLRDTMLLLYERSDSMVFAEHLPEFVHAADGAIASCSEFQDACTRFHIEADSLIAGLRSENDVMRHYVAGLHRRSLKERLTDIAVAAGTGYVIGRVTR